MLEITSEKEIHTSFYKAKHYRIKSPLPEIYSERMVFGIDPGTVNLGLAKVWRSYINLYQVKMEREDTALERILHARYILADLLGNIDYKPVAMIEGASYGKIFRQVELAEVRASMIIYLHDQGVEVRMEAPSKIRKLVFGNGKTKAEDEWGLKDAGAALACAFAAIKLII